MNNARRAAGKPSPSTLRAVLLAGGAIAAVLGCPGIAAAQDEPGAERITVTGTRIIRSGMVTPTPVTAVSTDELQAMSPATLLESLTQLPTFFNNTTPEQVNGGQNSGGSSLNLRGAGINRTLVLLDGRRMVPSNRFGSVDVAMFPEELVESVETVTGGASASYGTDAVAGVVNFILDTDYEGIKGHAQYGVSTYGDGQNYEVGAAFGMAVGDRGHLIGSIERYELDAISDFEGLSDREFYRQSARVTNPAWVSAAATPNVVQWLVRPYAVPTNWNQTGFINQPGSTLDKLVFNPDGSVTPFVFSGVGALRTGCNCQAEPTQTYGVDADDEVAAGNERTTAFLHYEHEFTNTFSVFAQGLIGHNEVSDRRESIALVPATWQARIFADNAFLPANIAATMNQAGQASVVAGSDGVPSVGYAMFARNSPDTPLGDTRQITINELAVGTVGFDWELDRAGFLNGWVVNGYYQYGKNEQSFDTDNGIRVDRLPLALDAVRHPTTGQIVCYAAVVNPTDFGDCVPINIFGGLDNVTPEAAAYIVDDYKHAIQETTQHVAEIVASGDIWDGFGAGPVSGAVGASYREEHLDQSTPDPTDEFPAFPNGDLLSDRGLLPVGIRGLIPQNLPNGILGLRNVPPGFTGDGNSSAVTFSSLRTIEGGYDVKEAFGELNVPLLANLPLAQQFDVTLATRWADYSGSGEIWAWKFGANWQVYNDLRLRATQSRDVRAASLRERFDQTRGGANVTDPLNGGITVTTASFSGGNENVAPEEADTITIGAVYQPSFVDGLSMSLDWYQIDIAGAIAQLTPQNIVNGCFAGDTTLCQFVIRGPTNQIDRVDNLFINLQSQVIEGVDFEASFNRGPFGARVFASYLLENSIQNPNGPVDDRAGDVGSAGIGLPELKVTGSVSYTRGPFMISIQERYIDGGLLDRTLIEGVSIDDNTIDDIWYTDLAASYALGNQEQYVLFGNINNVLNEEPRSTPGIIGRAGTAEFNGALGDDQIGRRFTVGVRVAF